MNKKISKPTTLKSKVQKKSQPTQLNEAVYEKPLTTHSSSFVSIDSSISGSTGQSKRRDRASRMKKKADKIR